MVYMHRQFTSFLASFAHGLWSELHLGLRSHYVGFKEGIGANLELCWVQLKIVVASKGTYLEIGIGFCMYISFQQPPPANTYTLECPF